MRFNQVATASIWLGIHMPGTACRAYISFSKIRIKSEVTKPSSLAGLAAIIYPKKSSNHHGKSEIPYCPAEPAN